MWPVDLFSFYLPVCFPGMSILLSCNKIEYFGSSSVRKIRSIKMFPSHNNFVHWGNFILAFCAEFAVYLSLVLLFGGRECAALQCNPFHAVASLRGGGVRTADCTGWSLSGVTTTDPNSETWKWVLLNTTIMFIYHLMRTLLQNNNEANCIKISLNVTAK